MRYFYLILLFPSIAQAQDQYNLHDPIVLRCKSTIATGESAVYFWSISGTKSVIVDDGKVAHVWAQAGTYTATTMVMKVNWDEKKINQEQFTQTFVVGNTPPPPPTDPPPLPPGSTLEATTRKALAAVPDHPKKKATAIALASVFEEVGNQYDAGNITTEELFPTLETAINTVINALGTAPHWGTFQLSIKAAINAEKLTPAELPTAFGQIAQGLTNDEESIIDIAPSVIALIQAIIAKDQGAIVQAVIQIVLALVGGL